MKIGIITFHRAHNYGAVLQCYALQEFLRTQGHDVSVIDYNNRTLWDGYDWFRPSEVKECFQNIHKIPKRVVKLLIRSWKRIFRFYKFKRFQENSLNLRDTSEINTKPYDLILIGSDQVWNLEITKGFDKYYWGDFTHPTKTLVATYAASLKKYWSETEVRTALDKIRMLNAVSVREADTAAYITKLDSNIHPIIVPDPVFLLTKEQWLRNAVVPKIKQPYILFYQAMDSDEVLKVAKEIAAKQNKRLIILSANVLGANSAISRNASPFDFIGWIKGADLVVTSSFHALAFSIILQKPFYCVNLNKGHDSRLLDLLNHFGLSDRWINTINDCKPLDEFEPSVNIEEYRSIALSYINHIK